ncbi:hypothetical protein GF325_15955 [Candidatus Bathyarchaeota archaeon]|nr:hypothetical protein [Candidatus Bathyarchaeota archaeon]
MASSLINAFYIFNQAGTLIFHHQLGNPREIDPKLISAFLSSINSWAKMYSNTGLSLFQTGSERFLFERSIYSTDLVFCISATNDHVESDLTEKITLVKQYFIHHFWEDREKLESGVIPESIDKFKVILNDYLKKKG